TSGSIAADEFRALSGCFLVHAVAGAAILGETVLLDVAFLQRMGVAHCKRRRADHARDFRAAPRTLGQRNLAALLQQVEVTGAVRTALRGGGVFEDRHGLMMSPRRDELKYLRRLLLF